MSSPSLPHLRPDDFQGLELKRRGTWLVEFGAQWCPPCRLIEPILASMAAEHDGALGVAQIDGDAESELAARFGVRGLPTLLLFRDGEVVGQRVGALRRDALEAWVKGL